MLAPVAGSSLTIVGGQQIAADQPIGISGKRLRLQVPPADGATFVPDGFLERLGRRRRPGVPGRQLPAGHRPGHGANVLWQVETLSGVAGLAQRPAGTGARSCCRPIQGDAVVGEAAVVSPRRRRRHDDARLSTRRCQRIYDATTVRVNANAVDATNGETVQEILGSGNAANDPLQFTLKQSPLTYRHRAPRLRGRSRLCRSG